MRLKGEQLAGHLQQSLKGLYMIYGDEPLQCQELCDQVRAMARKRGCDERVKFVVDHQFDWQRLSQVLETSSLFAAKRLVELYLESGKPGDTGGRFLRSYAQKPPPDVVLLISAPKLEASAQKSAWFKAIDSAGIVLPVYPIEAAQLPRWIAQRLASKGLVAPPAVAERLAERVEGNLLAAVQEIDKLALQLPNGEVSEAALLQLVEDSARFSPFDLVDAALGGEVERTLRIGERLREEGVEPILVAWSLSREISQLNALLFSLKRGIPVNSALDQQRIWERRKPLWRAVLKRIDSAKAQWLLRQCARLDQRVKGEGALAYAVDPWDDVMLICLHLADAPLPTPQGDGLGAPAPFWG